jgi:hypothetical protein
LRILTVAAWLLGASVLGLAIVAPGGPAKPKAEKRAQKAAQAEDPIEFNRDIRPILSNKCLACHGNDPKAVRAGLRLNSFDGATAKLPSGDRAIVPGKPDQSELVKRIYSKDADDKMPPDGSNKTLTDEERQTLKRWIQEGAVYKPHWAFVKPTLPPLPRVKQKGWAKNPIDLFILAKLEHKGLTPSGPADKATLLRRVSLDLTGIPPTIQELDAFLKDKSPNAYEKVVDRLLASPRYGERMAMEWMDYARYADSNGYQADFERYQWRWRDWVINAYNNNMHYDQFAIKQLAGDMLPNATLNDKIATGFNRNHRINTEGGVIPEEWRVETVIDRVETTSTVFLGLTSGCARCHDHKYDPITQKEFYSLFAYFNNVPETGSGVEMPVNHPPLIQAPTPAQQKLIALLRPHAQKLKAELEAKRKPYVETAQTWNLPPRQWPQNLEEATVARYALAPTPHVAKGEAPTPTGAAKPALARSSGALATNDKEFEELGNVGNFEFDKPFSYALWVRPIGDNGSPIAKMDAGNDYRGWDLFLDGRQPAVHIINKWPQNSLKVKAQATLPKEQWSHIAVSYDGSHKPKGLHFYLNGEEVKTEVEQDSLTATIQTSAPLRLGRRTNANMFTGEVDEPILFNKAITAAEAKAIADVDPAVPLLAVPVEKRTAPQKDQLANLYALNHDPAYAALAKQQTEAQKKLDKVEAGITTLMVMEEMPKPRTAYLLIRGQYDHHGPAVEPAVPDALPPLPKGVPNNRLGLAKWIVSRDNPLTARVTVNRYWERFFGTGIVETTEDFGTRAEFPSHPELLDWLACEFMDSGWNVKKLLKTIVMSATYQQSSASNPKLEQVDPLNRLLARGPRFRLPAEVIRDQSMAFSGTLAEKIGGPSVRPYQPDGIWDETSFYGNLHNYKHSTGEDLHRRSLYTIWKRTAAPPNMLLFDASTRETCRVRRARTDTPLQALALLNDETYLEAARALAQSVLKKPLTDSQRIALIFRTATCRKPETKELAVLKAAYQRRLAHYKAEPKAAEEVLAVGDLPRLTNVPPARLAAFTLLASTVLNLDETITKE